MNREDCFFLGKIVKTTGLKGQVVLLIEADDPYHYKELESVFVEQDKQLVPFFIESISIKSNGHAYTKFKDINTIEAAEKLKRCDVYLPVEDLEEFDESMYYYHELPGFLLCDENENVRANIVDVASAGHNYLAVVNYNGVEAFFPLNPQLFIRIDRDNKKIFFTVPDGLLDIYTDPHSHVNDEQ